MTVWEPGGDWTLRYRPVQLLEFARTRDTALRGPADGSPWASPAS